MGRVGVGDMKKSVYDPDKDGVIALAQLAAAVCSETEADNKDAARFPSGSITLWHGTIANIPAGFVICDGNNSTPNLLTKFVQGVATAATNPGATGGAATHTLIASEMPSHAHSYYSTGSTTDSEYGLGQRLNPFKTKTTGSAGSNSAHQNEPPFYDVAFLMKT